ncbi:MAG: hypothetical protein ACKVQW_02805 [Pyrinomonadaceae bacterium]
MASRIILFHPHVTELQVARMTGKLKGDLSFSEQVRVGDFAMLIGGGLGLYGTGNLVKLNKTGRDKMSVEISMNQVSEDLVSIAECRTDPEFQEILSSATDNFPEFSPALFAR